MVLDDPQIDAAQFEAARELLGGSFIRILGYFLEDGETSVAAIEAGFRAKDAAAIVRPAHRLKGEAFQFGATTLGELARTIEYGARRAVEIHETPDDLLVPVAKLRPTWRAVTAFVERETNPLCERRRA
jgi:histidine phosphotransfer protein HptB